MEVLGKRSDFAGPEKCTGLLSAICDKDRWVLALAVIAEVEKKGDSEIPVLSIISPSYPEERAKTWIYGRLRLSPDTWEEMIP